MNKFYTTYGFYPKYPVADAGYGSYNNYIFCEQQGMEKYMKFPMFKKETTDKKYHEDKSFSRLGNAWFRLPRLENLLHEMDLHGISCP